jgi:hypothetical protein
VFVLGKPFQPSLMFVGKAWTLHKSGATERCFTQICTRLGGIGLPGTNNLAYFEKLKILSVENFTGLAPWGLYYKTFTAMIKSVPQ